jgi:phosphatidylserine/phosphatidylglycerophosphate/cardiolipin synthase-like enzyme
MKALAIANNDIVYLYWTIAAKIPGCLGFTVRRIAPTGAAKALPAFVGFDQSEVSEKKKNTDFWPIQSFQWKDLFVPKGVPVRYQIAAVTGQPKQKLEDIPGYVIETGPVVATDVIGSTRVVFNRGLISTQALAKKLKVDHNGDGKPESLRAHIENLKSRVRRALAGQAPEALMSLLRRARAEGGTCFCALYELSDPELISAIKETKGNIRVILSNTGAHDDTNEESRAELHAALGEAMHDRMLGGSGFFIGHNKFVVYVDSKNKPRAVLTGSTNWTPTGLCAQTNNAVVIESPALARTYLTYWNALLADGAVQDKALRDLGATMGAETRLGTGQGKIRTWFSPNTPQKRKPASNPATPPDLKEVFDAISAAKHGVMFLIFSSGAPSIASYIRDVAQQRRLEGKNLFVRGAISDTVQSQEFRTRVYNDSILSAPNQLITGVAGVDDDFAFWEKEIAKMGFAVIHDKIVVIDPFTRNCVVVTGSHNLGFKASYSNDENLNVIRGNRKLAEAYAAHVLDVVNHFNFRTKLKDLAAANRLDEAFKDLDETDSWQNKYFKNNFLKNRDRFFFA